jgi:hypothetical protein
MTLINGEPSQSVSFVYQVTAKRPLSPGEYPLPRGQIVIEGNAFNLESPKITIEASPAGRRKGPVDFAQVVENLSPFEGEQLTYRCELVSSADISNALLEETTLPSFFREDFPEQKQVVRRVSNSRVFSVREAIYPNKVGEITIPQRSLTAKVKVPANSQEKWGALFDDLWTDVFDDFNFKPIKITAQEVKLNVRPLPPKSAEFSGYTPVGKTTVTAKMDRAEIKAGETALIEVEVQSEGNLKPLEFDFSKILPKHLRVYPERAEVVNTLKDERVIQKKYFRAAIVPEYGGNYQIASPRINYFDPKTGEYQVAQTGIYNLIVGGTAPPKETPEVAPTAITPEISPIPENRSIAAPVLESGQVGISRRWFSIFFATLLIFVLVNLCTQSPKLAVENSRNAKDILRELKNLDWKLDAKTRRELAVSLDQNSDRIISLIDRVNFSSSDIRPQSIADLEAALKELQ